jgi:hypothetical protein
MAASEADCGLGAGCVRRHEAICLGAFNPSPAPNPSQFSGVLERLAEVPYSHIATPPHRHRSSVSSDRLQLSCFKLGVRVLLIWHF